MQPLRNSVRNAALAVLLASPLPAQAPPSPAEVLGHGMGEAFTDHAGIVKYAEALAAASPNVELRRYGTSVEGRPLLQLVIARPEHLAGLDSILARNRELTDPSTPETRARALAASNPAVVYFSYGVHGNESSSSEAALWTAWDLARGADEVAGVLDRLVVVIDPAVNPDGRDRYVQWYRQAKGVQPNPNPAAREHHEPWPGGRFNHYLFDLNRDWAWLTQPETRARIATWSTWTPQVHVDFHEMSPSSTYFFFPATPPINPIYPEHILEWGRRFGEANAAAFDARGWAYYTAESFDLFYPGYGDSWPSLLGAIGMTYEQAGGGSAGLAYAREDGDTLTLRERAEHHRVSGQATLRAAAAGKDELLADFARFHRGVGEGMPDILLVPGSDPAPAEALVALLRDLGIDVHRAGSEFRADARPHAGFAERDEFPAGTYRVPARQPRGRLALTLLLPETVLDATFSYDVSAWALPYAYGVEAHRAERVGGAEWVAVGDIRRGDAATRRHGEGGATAAEPYGYLLPPGFASWPGVVRFLRDGGRATVLDQGFTLEGRDWPAGTIFLPRGGEADLTERVRAAGLLERAVPASTGLTTRGNDLGTGESYALRLPRLAVVSGAGVSPTSFGAHWFFLDHTLGLPFDAVLADDLERLELHSYDVLVVPDLRGSPLEQGALDALGVWVRGGGTLVAVDGGAAAVATPIAEIALRTPVPHEDSTAAGLEAALRSREERRLHRWEQEVPGTVLALRVDASHPLAFGIPTGDERSRFFTLHAGGPVFEPSTDFESVAFFPDELAKTSGVISQENLGTLEQSTWLATRRVGRGRVILFADDPLFRHFWYAAFQPYANALLLGPRL